MRRPYETRRGWWRPSPGGGSFGAAGRGDGVRALWGVRAEAIVRDLVLAVEAELRPGSPVLDVLGREQVGEDAGLVGRCADADGVIAEADAVALEPAVLDGVLEAPGVDAVDRVGLDAPARDQVAPRGRQQDDADQRPLWLSTVSRTRQAVESSPSTRLKPLLWMSLSSIEIE